MVLGSLVPASHCSPASTIPFPHLAREAPEENWAGGGTTTAEAETSTATGDPVGVCEGETKPVPVCETPMVAPDEAAAEAPEERGTTEDTPAGEEAALEEPATDEAAPDEAAPDEAAPDEAAIDEAAPETDGATDEAATDEATFVIEPVFVTVTVAAAEEATGVCNTEASCDAPAEATDAA